MRNFFRVSFEENERPLLKELPENDIGRNLYRGENSHCIIKFPAESMRRLETTASVGVSSSKVLALYFLLPLTPTEAIRFEISSGRWILLCENPCSKNARMLPKIFYEATIQKTLGEFFPPARW